MQLKHEGTIPLSLGDEDYLLTAATTSISSRRRGSRAATPLRASLHSDVHNHAQVRCAQRSRTLTLTWCENGLIRARNFEL